MIEPNDEMCFVYATFPDADCARKIGRVLVEQKLAACVNVLAPMTSIYSWQGKIEEGPEISALIKTRRRLVDAVVAAARPIHPYTVPCFLVLPIEAGNADYLAWARGETIAEPPVAI